MTTPGFTSTYVTTPPSCDVRVIDYESRDVSVGASSQMPAGKAVSALEGSDGFWSPKPKDEEDYPYVYFQVKQIENAVNSITQIDIGTPRPFSEKFNIFRKHVNGRVVTIEIQID